MPHPPPCKLQLLPLQGLDDHPSPFLGLAQHGHGCPSFAPCVTFRPGADFIECDVVLSSDLVPHCRHEPNLAATTDVLKHFRDRERTYLIDGERVAGVFSVDLTAAEMATLRAVQPWPFRNQSYNGRYGVPTLEQYLQVAKVGKGSGGGCCVRGWLYAGLWAVRYGSLRALGWEEEPCEARVRGIACEVLRLPNLLASRVVSRPDPLAAVGINMP